jgi:hypothetical protein
MRKIKTCSPLTKIFLFMAIVSFILAIIHKFTEKSIKEAVQGHSWSATKDEDSLTFTHKGKPIFKIDKNNPHQYLDKEKHIDEHPPSFAKKSDHCIPGWNEHSFSPDLSKPSPIDECKKYCKDNAWCKTIDWTNNKCYFATDKAPDPTPYPGCDSYTISRF